MVAMLETGHTEDSDINWSSDYESNPFSPTLFLVVAKMSLPKH